jgi:hypothetical protein
MRIPSWHNEPPIHSQLVAASLPSLQTRALRLMSVHNFGKR